METNATDSVGLAGASLLPGTPRTPRDALHGLGSALARLDARLDALCTDPHADATFHGAPLVDPAEATLPDAAALQRLLWLQQVHGLDDIERDVLLIALAPEIDPRHERRYAALQGETPWHGASVGLALTVLCAHPAARLAHRARFAPDAPLLRHGLIHLRADGVARPWWSRPYRLDEQLVRFLLGDGGLDERLAPWCTLTPAMAGAGDPDAPASDDARTLARLLAAQPDGALRLNLAGPPGCGQARIVADLARALGRGVLRADLGLAHPMPDAATWRTLVREAWLQQAVLHLSGGDEAAWTEAPGHAVRDWEAALQTAPVACVWECPRAVSQWGMASLAWLPWVRSLPPVGQRQQAWARHLETQARGWGHAPADAGPVLDPDRIDALAQRYPLSLDQIALAARQGWMTHRLRQAEAGADPDPHALWQALSESARAGSRTALAAVAQQIDVRARWDDVVLPADVRVQLQEICQQFTGRAQVLDAWGFGRKLGYGKGINVLFAGPSGTGKTMAAEVIAATLGLDLFKVDLSGLISKYIGETEKNLDRVFAAAEHSHAVLFFDEADALFGKRSEVKDAHDRYANIQVSYLLQRMERHEGIAILATNLRQNVDEAFVRRLAFVVQFPFPDEQARRHLWARAWPADLPLAADLDLDALARQWRLSGGHIKNVALAAAYLAAAEGEVLSMRHVHRALQREFAKLGKSMPSSGAAQETGP